MSDVDTATVVDSLIVLDPEWPIREADMAGLVTCLTQSRRGADMGMTCQRIWLAFHRRLPLV